MIDITKITDTVGYEQTYLKVKEIWNKNCYDLEFINGLFQLIKQEFPDAELLPKELETHITIDVKIAGLEFYNMIQLGDRKEINLRWRGNSIEMTDNLFQIIRNKSDMGFFLHELKNLDVKNPTELGKSLQSEVDLIKSIKKS